jgi:hypothetical protein
MRNFLLASFTAATAVILSGEIFAGDQQLQSSVSTMAVNLADSRSNSETVVPSESTFPNQIDRAQTIKSVEDITVTDQLRDLIENRLQQYVPRSGCGRPRLSWSTAISVEGRRCCERVGAMRSCSIGSQRGCAPLYKPAPGRGGSERLDLQEGSLEMAETAREAFKREERNPRWHEAPRSGQAVAIGGGRPALSRSAGCALSAPPRASRGGAFLHWPVCW